MTPSRNFVRGVATGLFVVAVVTRGGASTPAPSYALEVGAWRADREARLKADGGWLTVAGLFWLHEGDNRFGTDTALDVVLPEGASIPRAGVFRLEKGVVTVRMAPDETALLDGKGVTQRVLRDDSKGAPDLLKIGRLTLQVIRRKDLVGIRVRDRDSAFRTQFAGLSWFPVDESWRVEARWEAYDPPRVLTVPNVLGQIDEQPVAGVAVFERDGVEYRLEPIDAEDELFFVFADGTTSVETYGGGRFLYAPKPKDGRLVLDFNEAISPPCAFTPYATCPLPPEVNKLSLRVTAGEMSYRGPGGHDSSAPPAPERQRGDPGGR